MKTIFSLVILCFSALVASAQIGTGSWYTGACLKYSYASSADGASKTNEFLVYPATYYSLNNHWGVGAQVSYDVQTTKGANEKNTVSTYAFEPGIRYYGKISDRTNCYLQSNLGFGGGATKYEQPSVNTTLSKNSFYGLSATPGIMWNVKNNFYLDFHYGDFEYQHNTITNETGGKDHVNSLLFNLNPWNVGVGLFYDFGGTK